MVIPTAISDEEILRKGESNLNQHTPCGSPSSMMDVSLYDYGTSVQK